MGGYKFRLQKLLDIRLDKEEECKKEFREAQSNKNIVEQKLLDLKGKQKLYGGYKTGESLVDQKIKQIYLTSLSNSILDTTIELEQRNSILEEKRIMLKEKQIERKTVETLKEKELKAYIKEQDLIEQRSNDEFALYAFVRNIERR